MSRLVWSRRALLDIQRLYRFLAAKNIDAAKRAVKAVRQGVKVLENQSALGRPVEDTAGNYHDWPIDFGDSGYVVRYRIDADTVTILAVRHQKNCGF